MSKSKDIRTLCASCRAEYELAGFEVKKIRVKNKEECDRCRIKTGWAYEIRDKSEKPAVRKRRRRRRKKKKPSP